MTVQGRGVTLSAELQSAPDEDLQALAAQELRRRGIRLRFANRALERLYREDVRANARALNRITLTLIVCVVDSFFLTEHKVAPEIYRLSAYLRFGLLTPLCLLFVLLDWRGGLGRFYGAALTIMAILPTFLVAILIVNTTTSAALPNLQATPLIQLVIMTSRLDIGQAAIVNTVSLLIYVAAIAICPIVPASFLPSMIMTAVAIGMGALAFAMRVDLRERQLFLLGQQNEFRRALLARQNSVLTTLTQIDALTGLGNRRYFDQMLQEAWRAASRQHAPLSLVIFDIDHFKAFNDALGHQAGDECLRRVGRAISQCVRDTSDTASRYGGEEFAIILLGTAAPAACVVAERVRAAVRACAIAHPLAGPPGYVTVSLGLATLIPDARATPEALIEAADRCLYAAKRQGRNQLASIDLTRDEAAQT